MLPFAASYLPSSAVRRLAQAVILWYGWQFHFLLAAVCHEISISQAAPVQSCPWCFPAPLPSSQGVLFPSILLLLMQGFHAGRTKNKNRPTTTCPRPSLQSLLCLIVSVYFTVGDYIWNTKRYRGAMWNLLLHKCSLDILLASLSFSCCCCCRFWNAWQE